GFRTQVQRVLHLVEGWRHARLLETLMDEAQKFELFSRQHRAVSPLQRSRKGLTETNHERTLSVRYVFCNHLIWREDVHQTKKRTWPPQTRPRRLPGVPLFRRFRAWSPERERRIEAKFCRFAGPNGLIQSMLGALESAPQSRLRGGRALT